MLGNILAPSPETLKAQKEEKKENKAARSNELERLRGLLEDYTNERKIQGLIPEDVEWIKKFLKNRISTIQSQPTITADAIEVLSSNKESQNFENLQSSLGARSRLYSNMKNAEIQFKNQKEELEKAKKPVPPEIDWVIKKVPEVITWLNKNQFLTPDEYTEKEKEINEEYENKFKTSKPETAEKVVEKAEEERLKKREEFSISGLFKEVLAYIGGYFSLFLILTAMLLGASLAVNLNVYKNWAYRLLYAFYGAVFCMTVIPYVLIYRWAFLGKQPKFYSLLPLVPYHWDNRIMQILFGWMSYRPDDDIGALREWERPAA